MPAELLDGRAIAATIRHGVAARAAAFTARAGRAPGLAVVLVGDDPANAAYARSKARAAERLGIDYVLHTLPAQSASHLPDGAPGASGDPTAEVVATIAALNADPTVDAILVECPLPPGYDAVRIQSAIDPARDVDGVTADSLGRLLAGVPGPRPATPLAVMALLRAAEVPIAGARAVVVGRSAVVGKPAALLLLAEHATVTIAHSRTRELSTVTRDADILVAAAGVPNLITADHVKPGATVIDVGTTAVVDGTSSGLVGDVDFDAVALVAGRLTPVPGGVGPVTTAMVLQTAVDLAEARMH